ncbi:MAG: hypothetical protein NVS3B26_13700 [Mycobacteriales bacterium]
MALSLSGVAVAATATAGPTASASPTGSPSAGPSAAPTPSPSGAAGPSASPAAAGPFATALVLSRPHGTVLYGTALTITGRLGRTDGTPIANAPVQILSRTAGQSANAVLATVRTGSDGRLSRPVSPRTTAEYQLRYGGDEFSAPAVSNRAVSSLQPRVSGAFTPAGVKLGQTSVLRGVLAPAYYGARITIARRAADSSWTPIATVGIDGTGAYSWAVKPGLVGRYVFAAQLPQRPAYLPATTPALAVQVDPRDLQLGDAGSDVLTLEKRLAAQNLDVGRIDGVFDNDLAHAVVAFQKSQGIEPTFRYDSATRLQLGAPSPVRLRYPKAGRAVEIDLHKQVLYLSEGGVLRRILDVSTGNGQLYDQDGVTHRATTPLGSFSIQRKIDDPNHQSPLGILYRPAFFYQGWAIHGSSSVPSYPASHGCVRITDPAMDRLYDLLTIGTPVTVYAS